MIASGKRARFRRVATRRGIASILGICVLSVILLLVPACGSNDGNPRLLANFKEHREAFDSLVAMVRQDRGLDYLTDTQASYDRHSPGPPIPQDRLSEYRRLLKDTGCLNISHSYTKHPGIYFDAANHGAFFNGWTKGYCYCILSPPLVVENVDKFPAPSAAEDHVQVFQRIDGSWYLYREYAQ